MDYKVAYTVPARPFVSPSARRELLIFPCPTHHPAQTYGLSPYAYLSLLIYLLHDVSAVSPFRDIQTEELLLVTK